MPLDEIENFQHPDYDYFDPEIENIDEQQQETPGRKRRRSKVTKIQ